MTTRTAIPRPELADPIGRAQVSHSPVQECGRRRIFGAVAVVIIASALSVLVALPSAEAFTDDGSLLTLEAHGYRYTYHIPTGGEGLFDRNSDPADLHNLLADRPAEAGRMRREIERRLHVRSLESLRARCADSVERLRTLGYL